MVVPDAPHVMLILHEAPEIIELERVFDFQFKDVQTQVTMTIKVPITNGETQMAMDISFSYEEFHIPAHSSKSMIISTLNFTAHRRTGGKMSLLGTVFDEVFISQFTKATLSNNHYDSNSARELICTLVDFRYSLSQLLKSLSTVFTAYIVINAYCSCWKCN